MIFMRKYFLALSLLLITATASAVPAKPGLWKTIRLTDGTEVRAQLSGDEHAHYWLAEDGTKYVENGNDIFAPVSDATLQQRILARRAPLRKMASRRLQSPLKVEIGERTHFLGQKKALVILANFSDTKFKTADSLGVYKRLLNEKGYNKGNFRGSAADYFHDQSNGLFELEFDVVGPYTMPKNRSYYGSNDSDGNDRHPDEMVVEACKQADEEVNFADYDWDGDGEADQVFVVYAGQGEADGGSSTTIWPHMYYLEATDMQITLDSTIINTYACSSELSTSYSSTFLAGIGTFCHEFSHCMGFPDFYDTSYSGWFGMDSFDLMNSGSYNGNGFCPPNYTAHEKMMCGWQEPIVLAANDTIIENLQSMSNHGETFIIYNEAHPDEYYMIENRQKTGWDTSYPARGLMITHVDFDKEIWEYNIPNTKITATSSEHRYYGYPINDHQRMTIVHADNSESSYSTSTDLYPYSRRDSLTATSTPATTLYNKNTDGTKLLKGAILSIKQNSDGTMNFAYRAGTVKDDPGTDDPGTDDPGTDDPGTDVPEDGVLFYESFDQCEGTGGNDSIWTTTMATSTNVVYDNEGWDVLKAYAGYKCVRMGNGSTVGKATTPTINFTGDEATLTFKAAGWNKDGMSLDIMLFDANDNEDTTATVTPSTVTMKSFEWTDFTVTIQQAQGQRRVVFLPTKRFMLDEVRVTTATDVTAIKGIQTTAKPTAIYTLDGRYAGSDASALRPGIYVTNGRKFVK